MAKVTAVIDIGSNSARMVVFKKTSRFGFHLLEECKSRVRISEDSYNNNGYLQEFAIQRCEKAIEGFLKIAKYHKAKKILCVATSAVRDAPNKQEFLLRVKEKCALNIKVINGEKEAFYGGVAALNLLHIPEGVTVDIGGGSTEFAVIKDRKLIAYKSLNIGTVRLKESFFDSKEGYKRAVAHIHSELEKLSQEYKCETIIGIGGSIRAISDVVMKKDKYPLSILHGFEYSYEKESELFKTIISSERDKLKKIGFKQERLDVIKEGMLIFDEIINYLGAKRVVTSGVGVREGVYLADLLRTSSNVFPNNFNPSIRSLTDRFEVDNSESSYLAKLSLRLFDTLEPLHKIENSYKEYLVHCSKLVNIGKSLNFYKRSTSSYEIALFGLNYGFNHQERVLIARILDYQQKKDLVKFKVHKKDVELLPKKDTLWWLSVIVFLATSINKDRSSPAVRLALQDDTLFISSDEENYLAKEYINSNNLTKRFNICWT